jgi:hypothetical protein
MENSLMSNFLVSLSSNWNDFLKGLADDHNVDVSMVIGGLCDWVFSSPQYKRQFEVWLDTVYPLKGQAEDRARAKGEEASLREEARQDEAEEEAHEDRNYSEDREDAS